MCRLPNVLEFVRSGDGARHVYSQLDWDDGKLIFSNQADSEGVV